jgi:hypothetical protein
MRRFDPIQMLVLNEISDNFEEPQHIHERLACLSERCQLTITQENVRQALTDLVRIRTGQGISVIARGPGRGNPRSPTARTGQRLLLLDYGRRQKNPGSL